MDEFETLIAERRDVNAELVAILDAAKADKRDLTDDEQERYDALEARFDVLDAQIRRIERQQERERRLELDEDTAEAVDVIEDTAAVARRLDQPSGDWQSFGEFLGAVAASNSPGGETDPRLYQGASGASSGVPSDGGFLVGRDYSTALLARAAVESSLLGRTNRIPIGPNSDSLEAPVVDETSRANGSRWGGVQVFRKHEAATVAASKPKFGLIELRLEDLSGLAYATERLLQDATALEAIMGQAFSEEFAFKIDDEIHSGTGAGEMLGFMNAAALVTVAKEGGQAAATVVYENIVNMWARCLARGRANAIWTYNQEIEPQLFTMALAVGTGGVPVYLPPGGIQNSPNGSLLGRPMVPIEQASALGTTGDLSLVDLSDYVVIEKGGLQAASSMHVRFIYDEMTFRWTWRINGQPAMQSALTPYKGAGTLSRYVTLATRA